MKILLLMLAGLVLAGCENRDPGRGYFHQRDGGDVVRGK